MALSLDATIFREYDIRGIVGKTLPVEGMRLIGRAFGTVVRRAGGGRSRSVMTAG